MSKKLLLADDSITIQKVIQITFAHEDYELTITDNGDAALTKAREIKPDLVMADIYMPGKNGYELATAIKQDPALQHVPVLLLAGSFEPFDEEKALQCRADAWIEKPFESQSLIDKVAELLDAARAVPQPEFSAPAPSEPVEAPFGEPFSVEPALAVEPEDPFADISFAEETPVAETEPIHPVDDWSDVLAEPSAMPVEAEPSAAAGEDAAEASGDVSLAEDQPVAGEFFAPKEETTAVDAGFDAFDTGDEEILPLDDDDILGAEDLEPIMEEQTLTPWSRAEMHEDDFFAGTVDEEITFEESLPEEEPQAPAFFEESPSPPGQAAFTEGPGDFVFEETAFAEEPGGFAAEEPASVEEPGAFTEGTGDFVFEETVFAEEPGGFAAEEPASVEEPGPAAVAATALEVEARAAAISETEIEEIVEKVVTKIVEKLAGAILEKVAWEVVPDLAENLIREEIRKIKDAAA